MGTFKGMDKMICLDVLFEPIVGAAMFIWLHFYVHPRLKREIKEQGESYVAERLDARIEELRFKTAKEVTVRKDS